MGPKVLCRLFLVLLPIDFSACFNRRRQGKGQERKGNHAIMGTARLRIPKSLSLGFQESCIGLHSLQTVPAALQRRQGRNGKRGPQGDGNPVAPVIACKAAQLPWLGSSLSEPCSASWVLKKPSSGGEAFCIQGSFLFAVCWPAVHENKGAKAATRALGSL